MKDEATQPASLATLCAVLIGLSCGSIPVLAASPTAAEAAIQQYQNDYITDTFEVIASDIAYEPYAGLQRGADGTALSGSGNSIDQAMLLARAVEGQVAAWRLVYGRLDDANLTQLLSGTAANRRVSAAFSADDYELYDPINDRSIRKIARDHFWLEVQEEAGDEWLALDPSFPHARAGQSYAKARRTYTDVPANQKQRLTITIMQQTADGRTRRLGRVVGDVAELARFPIALVIRGIPQYEEAEQESASGPDDGVVGSSGGLLGGGGLFGGGGSKSTEPAAVETIASDSENEERDIVGTQYRRELTYGSKEPQELPATTVIDADDATMIAREWIDFSLQVPGQGTRKFRRDLFVASKPQEHPAAIRRYSIAVVAGELSRVAFDDYRSALDANEISKAQNDLLKLKLEAATNDMALEVLQLESIGGLAPYLINLAFAFESDALTARLAAGAGVRVIRHIPRVLITSVETGLDADGDVQIATTLDLRLDEVLALPISGWPVGAASLFQRSRGMQESALEGRLLARFVEDSYAVITTEHVMREAQKQGHLLVAITPDNRAAIADLAALPAAVATRIGDTLDAGHHVIVPNAAAAIDGRKHWGWWDVDPVSGAFVGVMESGQHQAMVQYTVTLEKVGVNDAMGYVIGAIVGSTATMTLYAAKMIEYGQITPQLIAEVAAGIEQLTCVTCPSFEVIVSPLAASLSAESDCFAQTGKSIGLGGGASGNIAFCENYKIGISCAASLMLGTFDVSAEAVLGAKVKLDLGPLSCK